MNSPARLSIRLKHGSHLLLIPLLAAILASGSQSLRGAPVTWSGLGADGNWTTGGNWVGGAAPGSDVDVQFAGSTRLTTNNNDGSFAFHSLTFDAGAGAFTLNGPDSLTLEGGGITNSSSSLQTISLVQVGILTSQSWDAGTGGLDITAQTIFSGTSTLTVMGSGSTTMSGGISESPPPFGTTGGSIIKNGTGTLTLNVADDYTGATTLNAGTLLVGNNGALGSGTLIINSGTFGSNAFSIVLSNAVTVAGNFSVAPMGPFTLSGSVDLGATTRTITNTGTGGGNIFFSGVISGGAGLDLASTDITNSFNFSGAASNTYSGTTTVEAGAVLNLDKTGGAIAVTGDLVIQGTVQLDQANQIATTSTVIDNGTLNLVQSTQTIGTLNGDGKVLLSASGVLTVESGSFSGQMQDNESAGALVKSGTGAFILSGSSSYSGGTMLESGTLFADNNHALGTGLLTIDGGTTLTTHVSSTPGLTINNNILVAGDFNIAAGSAGGDGITLAGNIDLDGATRTITNTLSFGATFLSGTISNGGVTFSSTQGLDVFWEQGSAANTYTGLTTINNNAEVLLGRPATNSTILGDVLINAGGVLIDNFHDQIADTSTVTDNSTGAVTSFGTAGGFWLNGNNETIGALSGTGSVELQDQSGTVGAILTVGSGTFAGTIYDGGANGQIVKTGAGTFLLSGSNSYTGTTTVNGGLLQIDGTIASTNTLVNASGTLDGTGFIGGKLTNFGNVNPGDAPGKLTVAGNYTQASSGTLTIRVGGLAAGDFDVLAVGGHASLTGKLQLVRLNNFALQPGNKVVFLTATTGVSGTFSSVNTDTIMKAVIVYDPDDVALELFTNPFAGLTGLTQNQAAVARDLDGIAKGPGGNSPLLTFLDNQLLGNLPRDLDLIAPEELTSIFQISESLADVQASNIGNHLTAVRGENVPAASTTVGLLADGKSTVDAKDEGGKNVAAPATPANRWNLWMNGSGDFVRVQGDGNAAGYNFTTGGVTLGADYRVCDHFVVGLTGGYANTGATLTQGGAVDVNGGSLGIYSTAYGDGFYLNTLASGGYNSYDTHRAALGAIAQGNTDGAEFDGLISGGYDMHSGNWTVGPVVSAQYTYVSLNGFTEAGSMAPLNINSQNQDSLRTFAGFKVSSIWNVGGVAVTPMVTAGWQHEYLDSAFALDSSFANGAGNVFTVDGPKLGRNSAIVNAGVNVQWTPRIGTYLYYYGELGRKNYELNSVTGGVSFAF